MARTKLLGSDKENREKQLKKTKKKHRSPVRYIKDVIAELKKVSWPTFKSLLTYTGAVIAFIVIMAIITGVFDLGFTTLLNLLVK